MAPSLFSPTAFGECKVNTMFAAANAPSAESGPHERARRFPRSQLEGVGPARIPAPPVLLWHRLVRHWPLARLLAPLRQRRRAESTDRCRERGDGTGTGSGRVGLGSWTGANELRPGKTTHPGPTCNQLSPTAARGSSIGIGIGLPKLLPWRRISFNQALAIPGRESTSRLLLI